LMVASGEVMPMDFTRFRRHISVSKTKQLEIQRARHSSDFLK
jgi:hypothetical protein